MSSQLDEAWAQAEANPGKSVDIGRTVVCDACSEDYTDSLAPGGLIAGSYAYCPKCVDSGKFRFAERQIKARCPTLKAFADFVRDYRGPDGNKITIHSGAPAPRFTHCVECKEAFSQKNTRTPAGRSETQISGLCENCWDAVFADNEDEEDL